MHDDRPYQTLGSSSEGWTRTKAEVALENVLADVRRGLWQPEPEPHQPKPEPTFHEFASEWVAVRRMELRPRTIEADEWALSNHLLPVFAASRLSEITPEAVDRYRRMKLQEREALSREGDRRALSNASINATVKKLAQILDVALEYGHLDRNPARGRRRLLKAEDSRPNMA